MCWERERVEERRKADTTYVMYNCSDGNTVLRLDCVRLTSFQRLESVRFEFSMNSIRGCFNYFRKYVSGDLWWQAWIKGSFAAYRVFCCTDARFQKVKTLSGIKYGMAVACPCIQCTGTAQNFQNMVQSPERSVRENLCARSNLQGWCKRRSKTDFEKKREGSGQRERFICVVCDRLKELSLSGWLLFLESCAHTPKGRQQSYAVSRYEPL